MRVLDLFCGRFGWGEAFAARGHEVIGIDLVAPPEIPQGCTFIQADILMMYYQEPYGFHIAQHPAHRILGHFDFICASSPCEEFSVFGMPHFHPHPKHPGMGIKLFAKAWSLCMASKLPHVLENVRPAQKFLGNAAHHCGPFYLWGTGVPPLMPQGVLKGISQRVPGIKTMTRAEITAWRRENDPMWSGSKSEKRKQATAKAATIPPELAACVCDYAERILATERESRQVGTCSRVPTELQTPIEKRNEER